MFYSYSFRIEHAFDCEKHSSTMEKHMIYYTNIINAIIIHNRAIKYVAIIDILINCSRLIAVKKKTHIQYRKQFRIKF